MMDNDNSLNKRPTFKRALRNISMTSIFITMMLIWLLLSVTSVLTLKQYAQKNLALTAATMTYSLEAAVVFADGPAATETLAALGQQFSTAEVRDKQQNILASWHYTRKDPGDTFSNFISHWLFPAPIIQPIRHNGETIGEVRLTARDSSISHFIWFSLAVLTAIFPDEFRKNALQNFTASHSTSTVCWMKWKSGSFVYRPKMRSFYVPRYMTH